jgi:small subunit ribosomal protein S2
MTATAAKNHPSGGFVSMASVTMKMLLEAGVHFGHQSRRWNPKMKPYIYTERNGIYIIDLKKTLRMLRDAYKFIRDGVADGGKLLFVGTKKQAKSTIEEEAKNCDMLYVTNRWLGGTLTNFRTIRRSIDRMIELETMWDDGTINQYSKKEQSQLMRELSSLKKNLEGLKEMRDLPQAVFVIDPHKESIACREARRVGIPVVGVVDTNCDPETVDWVIPGNDDAIRSIKLMTSQMAEAVKEGLAARETEPLAADVRSEVPPQGLTAEELEKRYEVMHGQERPPAPQPAGEVQPQPAAPEQPEPAQEPSARPAEG